MKAILKDGAAHDVDSSEMAFKIAGSIAYKEAARKAGPAILEPIMAVEVRTPEEYMGDVIGDLNSRRGQIASMEDASGVKVVRASVPLSEMFGYVGDLRSKTSGRAVYSMTFETYSQVPAKVAEEIIAKNAGSDAPASLHRRGCPATGPSPPSTVKTHTARQRFRTGGMLSES